MEGCSIVDECPDTCSYSDIYDCRSGATAAGAWAQLLRHEEITDPADLAGISTRLWAVRINVSDYRYSTPGEKGQKLEVLEQCSVRLRSKPRWCRVEVRTPKHGKAALSAVQP